jgi:hypothetical protein
MKIRSPARLPDPGAVNDFSSNLIQVRYVVLMRSSWCADLFNIEVRKMFCLRSLVNFFDAHALSIHFVNAYKIAILENFTHP